MTVSYEDYQNDLDDDWQPAKCKPPFVVAATIASELNQATAIAQDMSIVAKNARAIALRAGDQASGFKAITNFIKEMSANTIETARVVNRVAIEISAISVRKMHADFSQEMFNQAMQYENSDADRATMCFNKRKLEARVQRLEQSYDQKMTMLKDQLDEINQQMRAAGVIAVTSRVEASRAGEYQESLNVVADNVYRAAEGIRMHMRTSQSLMAEAEDEEFIDGY